MHDMQFHKENSGVCVSVCLTVCLSVVVDGGGWCVSVTRCCVCVCSGCSVCSLLCVVCVCVQCVFCVVCCCVGVCVVCVVVCCCIVVLWRDELIARERGTVPPHKGLSQTPLFAVGVVSRLP